MKNKEENKEEKTFIEKIPDTQTVEKGFMKIVTIILIIAIFILIIGSIVMANALLPADPKNTDPIDFKIESGWGSSIVVDKLEEAGLVKNAFLVKLYLKVQPENEIKEGTYKLNKAMGVLDIFDTISSNKSVENETVNVTFIEGKRFTDYAKQISETFDISYDDIIAKGSNKEYLNSLIDKYWFITDDILNENIYYPLEGYLFPDQYNIRKNADIETIFATMLDQMDLNLTKYKEDIGDTSVNSLLTLASMVELEAGKGNIETNEGKTISEREAVSSVFTNRINIGMKLGSDVTTFYAVNKVFQDELTAADLDSCNGYNTRGVCVEALPVGPICSPSLQSILAALNPAETNYYYFVADKNGELYFAVDQVQHNNNIEYLKNNGLWG